jgi:hypothetical protein
LKSPISSHISTVRDHTFENLIALCPTCHTRYDNGDIDRLSMKGYKANLGLVTRRYGEVERRLLDALGESRLRVSDCLVAWLSS